MNCREAEQLIPLFVEADLDAAEMQQVSAHIESCAACCDLAAEFQASQSSLRAIAMPAFDERMLTAMRSAVMQQVSQEATQPAFVEWLQPLWSWRWAFVVATAMLVLVSNFVMSRRSTDTNPVQIGATTKDATLPTTAQTPSETTQQPSPTSQVFQPRTGRKKIAPGGVRASERNPGNNVPRQFSPERATDVDNQIAAVSVAPSGTGNDAAILPRIDTPNVSSAENALQSPSKNTPEPEMLRMEFQTADPNIRIIWLTPKEPAQTNPATDTK
jgi:hypothetical protein